LNIERKKNFKKYFKIPLGVVFSPGLRKISWKIGPRVPGIRKKKRIIIGSDAAE